MKNYLGESKKETERKRKRAISGHNEVISGMVETAGPNGPSCKTAAASAASSYMTVQ
jgi:hypothetical protein